MERPTTKFTTSYGKHEIEIKSYVTAGEAMAIFGVAKGEEDRTEEVNNKTVEICVVSVDGVKENVKDIVTNQLPMQDYIELLKETSVLLTFGSEVPQEKKESSNQ